MPRVTVLVADMPQIQVDMLKGFVASAPDLRLIDASARADLDETIDVTKADVLLVDITRNVSSDLPLKYRRVLRTHPALAVLAVEADGRKGSLWELVPRCIQLGEVSPAALVDAIRQTARRRAAEIDAATRGPDA